MKKAPPKNYNLIFRSIFGVLSLAVMGVIFFLSNQERGASNTTSITFISLVLGKGADVAVVLNAFVRELAHMAEFAFLAFCLYMFFKTFKLSGFLRCAFSAIISSVYAASDEIHQVFVPGRSGQIYDIIVDVLGVLLSVLFLHLFFYLGEKREIKRIFKTLTNADEIVLRAFSSHITGEKTELSVSPELFEASSLKAYEHKILPAVYDSFFKCGGETIKDKIPEMKFSVASSVTVQIKKADSFFKVYERILQSGIKAVCVKGPMCAVYYPSPEMRVAGDFDILVSDENYDKCAKILVSCGFPGTVSQKSDNDFFDCQSGCNIELHRTLFPEDKSVYSKFNKLLSITENDVIKVSFGEKKVYTLSPDKHMLYLVLHAFKHFLVAGVGIRQVCDISLFAKNNKIDWNYIFTECKKVNIDGFLNGILLIGEKYFGFYTDEVSAQVAEFKKDLDITLLLCDIMSGGVYGGESPERHHSGNITFSAYNKKLAEERESYKVLFPSKAAMKEKYPNMKDSNFALVCAWVKRIFRYFILGGSSSSALDIASKRKSVLKKYGIVD